MTTAKDSVRRLLDELPDDVGYEDILYHIYVQEKVAKGMADVAAGRVVTQEELERQLAPWLIE
ncbi:MAG: hypothetical protein EXR52_02035 [Dehalococcoidia bacterium]|nr:hypothetical protein [Dehalococcoidia bacterium]